jgi:hypothetical protein
MRNERVLSLMMQKVTVKLSKTLAPSLVITLTLSGVYSAEQQQRDANYRYVLYPGRVQ